MTAVDDQNAKNHTGFVKSIGIVKEVEEDELARGDGPFRKWSGLCLLLSGSTGRSRDSVKA